MDDLTPGLYKMLVTERLRIGLDAIVDRLPSKQRALPPAEASDRIAWHLSRQIERALSDVREADRTKVGIEVARSLLARLGELLESDPLEVPIEPATI